MELFLTALLLYFKKRHFNTYVRLILAFFCLNITNAQALTGEQQSFVKQIYEELPGDVALKIAILTKNLGLETDREKNSLVEFVLGMAARHDSEGHAAGDAEESEDTLRPSSGDRGNFNCRSLFSFVKGIFRCSRTRSEDPYVSLSELQYDEMSQAARSEKIGQNPPEICMHPCSYGERRQADSAASRADLELSLLQNALARDHDEIRVDVNEPSTNSDQIDSSLDGRGFEHLGCFAAKAASLLGAAERLASLGSDINGASGQTLNLCHEVFRKFQFYAPLIIADPAAGCVAAGAHMMGEVCLMKFGQKAQSVALKKMVECALKRRGYDGDKAARISGRIFKILYVSNKIIRGCCDPLGEAFGSLALGLTRLLSRFLLTGHQSFLAQCSPRFQAKLVNSSIGQHIGSISQALIYILAKETGHTLSYIALTRYCAYYPELQKEFMQNPELSCNGLESNCKKRLNEILMIQSHDSIANLEDKKSLGIVERFWPNQVFGIRKQFEGFGIRSFVVPFLHDKGELVTGHQSPGLSVITHLRFQDLVGVFSTLKILLDQNPRELVHLSLHAYDQSNHNISLAMQESGLDRYLPGNFSDWNLPLGELIAKEVRLLPDLYASTDSYPDGAGAGVYRYYLKSTPEGDVGYLPAGKADTMDNLEYGRNAITSSFGHNFQSEISCIPTRASSRNTGSFDLTYTLNIPWPNIAEKLNEGDEAFEQWKACGSQHHVVAGVITLDHVQFAGELTRQVMRYNLDRTMPAKRGLP